MRNIPIFTAEHGLASLILREIPYSGRAYVLLRAVWNGETAALLEECGQFCRAAGAADVYASQDLEPLPAAHAYDVLELSCAKSALPPLESPVDLEPLTADNGGAYLEIYNRCFRDVPGAAAYDREDLKRLLGMNRAFLTRRAGRYAGVAELSGAGLAAVAVLPEFHGLGCSLTRTALERVDAPVLSLRVADTNGRAMALYRRLGFGGDRVVSRWWKL